MMGTQVKEQKETKEKSHDKRRKGLLSWFFTREEPDKDYLPDLKSQWNKMDTSERIKFIAGAIVGAAFFIGALVLVYVLLSAMVG
jgi:hypothetical protein